MSNKLVHYSRHSGLKTLDPEFMGTGAPSEELKQGPVQTKQTSFYREGVEPESVVASGAKSKYTVNLGPEHKLYDIYEDPQGLVAQSVKQTGGINTDHIRGTLKNAGYHGFYTTHPHYGNQGVVNLLHPMPVSGEEEFGKAEEKIKKEPHPFKVGDRVKGKLPTHQESLRGTVTAVKTEQNRKHKMKIKYDSVGENEYDKIGHGGKWDLWDHAGYWQKDSKDIEKADLQKSPYGPKGAGLYSATDNARRKMDRTSEDIGWGPNRAVHSTKPTASQQALVEAREYKQKSKKNPIKIYSPEEIKAFEQSRLAASEDLEKGLHGDWQKEGYKLDHGQDRHGYHYVTAYDKNNNVVGEASFSDHLVPNQAGTSLVSHPDYMKGWDVKVHPDHQRKGLASAMYEYAEKMSGKKILQGGTTSEGSSLWEQKDRKFGNLNIHDKINLKTLQRSEESDSFPQKRLHHSEILAHQKSVDAADLDNKKGKGSKTSGPLHVWQLEDGRHLLVDGHHRFAQGLKNGQKYFDVHLVGQGYSDYWATPRAGEEFKGFGKSDLQKEFITIKSEEPLMKPYHSEAQRRWAHTAAGTKALGGKKAVKEWDTASRGLDLPEKSLKKDLKSDKLSQTLTRGSARSSLMMSHKDTLKSNLQRNNNFSSQGLNKSSENSRINTVTEEDLMKGRLLRDSIIGNAVMLGLAINDSIPNKTPTTQAPAAQYQIHQTEQKQSPVDNFKEKMLRTVSSVESGSGANYNHKKISTGLNAGHSAAGNYGLMPITTKEIVQSNPSLSKKYGHLLNMSPDQIKNELEKSPKMQHEIAGAHLDKLTKIFGKNPAKIGYAWLAGIEGAKHAIKNGLDINNHWHTKKILKEFNKK